MSRDADLYLQDIIEAVRLIRSFTSGMSKEDFAGDLKTQHACVRNLEVIGEAVKSLSESLRDREPAVPWRKIAGLRDILIHQYFGIDTDILWDIITMQLTPLAEATERLTRAIDGGVTDAQ